jgi:hypothetical protein
MFAGLFPAKYLRFHRRDDKTKRLAPASRAVLQHLALAGPVTGGELCRQLDRTHMTTMPAWRDHPRVAAAQPRD